MTTIAQHGNIVRSIAAKNKEKWRLHPVTSGATSTLSEQRLVRAVGRNYRTIKSKSRENI